MTASSANPPHPRSTHLTDPLLLPFLAPSFSATSYLNTTLLPPPTKPSPTTSQPQPTLSTLASQTQSQISTLSAQTSRLSATLTALTDDILRSSSRLTYEIELLRGEANGLVEALTSSRGALNGAIKTFIPSGLHPGPHDINANDTNPNNEPTPSDPEKVHPPPTTDHINKLRTLHQVRASLTSVTQIFSLALTWPMPPSLLPSTSTSLISITSPSSQSTLSLLESSGQAALAALRREIEEMVVERGEIGRARARVQELRDCVGVWQGTSEERARGKWVGEVEGWVEGFVGKGEGSGGGEVVKRKMGDVERGGGLVVGGGGGRNGVEQQGTTPARTGSGAGFLRRLREEIYMD
ncbi:MAG: hypothetical protein LQ349_005087 [Xanthoria aureola]|nr:MAG: hypothetical protein LQ349_005087 [Xanthoria aureola]